MRIINRYFSFGLLVILLAVLAGCARQTRSISHSGYREGASYGYYAPAEPGSDPAFTYKGELNEFDVLGIAPGEAASEAEIRRTLDNSRRISLRAGGSLLLIQSGSQFPDGPMVSELNKNFRVVPFSGVPGLCRYTAAGAGRVQMDAESYSKSLRLAAARAGAETIVCYWGVLESESEHLPTKTVSWVPVLTWVIPDEKQHMRIRLKIALVDVRSGSWAVFSPTPFQDDRASIGPRRAVADQKQVELLKNKAYASAVSELARLYLEVASAADTQQPTPAR
jgi:hypothetical protein